MRIFSGDEIIEDDLDINLYELEAVNFILHRKFNKRLR